MGVRIIQRSTNDNAEKGEGTYLDSSFDQRVTTVDGYSFHWGVNERRNFLDQGVGAAHAAFKTSTDITGADVEEDAVPFGRSRT